MIWTTHMHLLMISLENTLDCLLHFWGDCCCVFFFEGGWFGAFDCFYLLRTMFVLCPSFNNKCILFLQTSEIMYAVKLKCLPKIAKCMSSLTVKLWSCLGSQANNCRQTASFLLVVNLKFNKKGIRISLVVSDLWTCLEMRFGSRNIIFENSGLRRTHPHRHPCRHRTFEF